MHVPRTTRRGRSRTLTLLALALWGMALVNLARAWQSALNEELLAGWQPVLAPRVLLVLSLLWALLFLAAGWGVWRRRGWGRRLARWLPPLYGLYSVGLALFSRSPYARGRWAVVALGWALATLCVRWLLNRPRFKIQFSLPR